MPFEGLQTAFVLYARHNVEGVLFTSKHFYFSPFFRHYSETQPEKCRLKALQTAFCLQIKSYLISASRCCNRFAPRQQILYRLTDGADGIAEGQWVFTSEEQAFIYFSTECGGKLDVDTELSCFGKPVAQTTTGQAV